jgi:uncharacterized protein (DUF2252 family)
MSEPLWKPEKARADQTTLASFSTWMSSRTGKPLSSYEELHRYSVADVCHRVVGVGSVGLRAYLVLLFGNGDDDPLFLQVKEAVAPVHATPALPGADHEHTREEHPLDAARPRSVHRDLLRRLRCLHESGNATALNAR